MQEGGGGGRGRGVVLAEVLPRDGGELVALEEAQGGEGGGEEAEGGREVDVGEVGG